ncbi:unnamed protein product [Kuraishia capsulata CBS 1993]|uniref:Uncharacterized protein n=1 Tax=Kuraishia capsulata CBS 1993 TaxID=1382522 RepID=W6MRJ3_9ASCO|nr:uncharacterized protein KUCA_T00000418001 [Kuraishia capsulata CBS 1993]CDK24455.1 unnamed protein product [Kuraishia capsulata CBS 1993]
MEPNGLFRIPTWTSSEGLVFVNLDQTDSRVSGDVWFKDLRVGDLNDFKFVKTWSENIHKNWKELAISAEDGGHASSGADFKKWAIAQSTSQSAGWFGKKAKKASSLSTFPISYFSFGETQWISRRLNPITDSDVTVIYELYVKGGASPDESAVTDFTKCGSDPDQALSVTIAQLSKSHYELESGAKTQIDASKIVQNVDSLELDVYCKSTCDEAVLAW